MNYHLFLLSWVTINLFRLYFVFKMGPMPQDAYYHFYSQHLDWSYLDHPPVIAYLIRLSSEIFGSEVWSVKLVGFIVTVLTQLFFYLLARTVLSITHARIATLLFCTTLMVSILSVVATPDVPLMFFWSVSILFLYKAIFKGKNGMWILAGLSMGLALSSKYTGILIPFGLFAFLTLSTKYRILLLTKWPYLALLIMLSMIIPVIWWNLINDFASVKYQVSERASEMTPSFQSELIFGFLGHQTILLLPPLFVGILIMLGRQSISFFKRDIKDEIKFLLCFSLPIIGGFLLIAPFIWVKINWIMPGYVAGILLATPVIASRWLKTQWIFVVVFHVLLAIEIIWYPVPIKSDDTWYGWEQLAGQWEDLKQRYPRAFTFSSDGYKTSAVLQFLSAEKIYGRNIIGQPGLQFDFIGDNLSDLRGRDAIYLNSQPQFEDPDKAGIVYPQIEPYFREVEILDPIIVYRKQKPVRKFQVFLCKDYLGPNRY